MSDKILDESIIEESEPITPDELITHLLQDLVIGNEPNYLATEFIEEFVLAANRPETGQILSLLEMPTESLVELLKGVVGQNYQLQIAAIETRGVDFLERMKSNVREQMTRLADDNAQIN